MPPQHTSLFTSMSSRRLRTVRLAGMTRVLLILLLMVQGVASRTDDSTLYIRWRLTLWFSFSPIFNRGDDAVSNALPSPSPLQTSHHNSLRQSHRSLQSFGEMVCNLDPTIVRAYRNASASNSVFILENASSTDLNQHDSFDEEDDDERDRNDRQYINLQQCSCAETRYGREGEYCPSDHSNMCILRGPNTPIVCFSSNEADAFVRTFWPITVAATLALLYALTCTFTGQLARQYAQRTVRTVQSLFHKRVATPPPSSASSQSTAPAASTTPATTTATTNNSTSISAQLIARDLNHLIQHQPEQAALLYRQYRTRERERQQRLQVRHNSWWYKGLQRCCVEPYRRQGRRRRHRPGSTTEQVEESPPSASLSPPTPSTPTMDTRSRLVLKTKVYAGEAGDAVETTANRPTTTSQSPLNLFAPFTATDPVPSLQALDDEMEHGTRCAICLIKLQPGDVVGDLVCKHMLHKDCLKDWLQRKNTCPLCQQVNIATLVTPTPLHGGGGSLGAPLPPSASGTSANPTLPFAVASTPWSLRTEYR
jgi:Ring finger domain